MDPRVPISGSSGTASCPSSREAADAARQRTARLTDTVSTQPQHPAAPSAFHRHPGLPQPGAVVHSVWERGYESGAALWGGGCSSGVQ